MKFISGENINEMKTSAVEIVSQEMDKMHKNSKKILIYLFLISCFDLLKNWRHQHDKLNIWERLFRPLYTKMKFSVKHFLVNVIKLAFLYVFG